MPTLVRKLILAAALACLPLCAHAGQGPQEEAKPFDSGVEQVYRIPMTPPKTPDRTLLLESTIFRPATGGPFKTVVINHGSPRQPNERRASGRARFEVAARWFLSKGWAVVVPMRRGYAASEGEWAEGYGSCEDPDFVTAGLSTANDIGAVVKYVRTLDFVDPDHIVVVGQSAGAWGTLAVSGRNLPGVVATIAVAPGRASIAEYQNCAPDRLVEAAGTFGAKGTTPLLWLNTSNDTFFGVPLVRRMVDAFSANGAPVEFVQLASFGRDGHSLLQEPRFSDYWTQPVETFLHRMGEM
ncbi:MAG: alpha/beta hydrolase family protein [Bacteroidales bacterium]